MKLLTIAALLFLALPQQNPTPKGSIEGLVVRVGTGEALSGARVTITRVQPAPTALPSVPGAPPAPPAPAAQGPLFQTTIAANTDGQGKFVFKDVEPGQYNLQVAMNGYTRAQYGERIVGGQGRPVTVAGDQALKDLVVRLTPAGYVSGRIRDLGGQPLVGVNVQLMKASYSADGQRRYQSAGSTRTNDRGEYRLYWVTPGRYYLNAGSSQGAPVNIGGGGASPNEVQDVYVSTYYPNVTDVSLATVLNVQPGNEIGGIDLSLNRQQLHRVRGRVIDARTERPPQAVTLTIGSRSLTGGGFVMNGGPNTRYNNADGTFELRDMAPGPYTIGAIITPTSGVLTGPTQQIQPRAQAALTVVNADVENVQLLIFSPLSLPGRMSIEGQSLSTLASLDRLRVQLGTVGDTTFLSPLTGQAQSQPPNADGDFKVDNLMPGDYRVTVSGMPPGYYLKAVRLEQLDGIDQPLRVSTAPSGALEVVLSPNGGQLDGTITDEKQQVLSGLQAVLIPDAQRNRFDLYKTATSDANGRFTIRGIPPGDYKVFAWEALEQFGYYDADLMRFYDAKGKPVRVTESSTQSIEVRVIPPTEP